MDETIELNFKLLNEESFKLTLSKDTVIEDLKALVHIECGIEPSKQRLIHQGQLLRDDKKLQDYPILNNHTIHIASVDSPQGAQNNDNFTNANSSTTGPTTANPNVTHWSTAIPFILGQMHVTRMGQDSAGSSTSWDSASTTPNVQSTATNIINGVVNSLIGSFIQNPSNRNTTTQQPDQQPEPQQHEPENVTAAQVVSEEPADPSNIQPDEITDLPENMEPEPRQTRIGQMFMSQINGVPVTLLGTVTPGSNIPNADNRNIFNSFFGSTPQGTEQQNQATGAASSTEHRINVTGTDYANPSEYHNQISTTLGDAIASLTTAKTKVDEILSVSANLNQGGEGSNANTCQQPNTIYVDSRSLSQRLPWQTLGQLVELLELETGWRLPTYYQINEGRASNSRWNPPSVRDPMALFINIFQQSISISVTVLNHVAEWQKSSSRLDAPTLARSAAICGLLASINGNLSSFLAWLLNVMSRSVEPSVLTNAMAWSEQQPEQQVPQGSNEIPAEPVAEPQDQPPAPATEGEAPIIEFTGVAGTRYRTWTQSVGTFTRQLIKISEQRGNFSDLYRATGSESFLSNF